MLHSLLGTRLAMSIAFHHQIDGQKERVNRIIKDMLHHYLNLIQDDYSEILAMIKFVYSDY